MDDIFLSLLILLVVIWTGALLLRPLGLPTIMGELVGGVIVGPAVLGWVKPNEIIEILAQMGIFFLMLHAGVETNPKDFFAALRRSWGVAIVGAIVPFLVALAVALAFDLPAVAALFVGLTMTATAVVITIKALQDLGLCNTRFARVIIAACVIDDVLTMVMFSFILGLINGENIGILDVAWDIVKVILYFGSAVIIGYFVYPHLKHPFRHPAGKGFTFVLVLGLLAGLVADWIGLHLIVGAYLAGLFFEIEVADANLIRVVQDRLYAISYSFLGPIFFISLGFHITFDVLSGSGALFIILLTTLLIVAQVASAGGMALRLRLPWVEAFTVGVGMCGRAEMAFILAALGLSMGAIDSQVFSVLIFTAFLLNLFTPAALKGCSLLLEKYPAGTVSNDICDRYRRRTGSKDPNKG